MIKNQFKIRDNKIYIHYRCDVCNKMTYREQDRLLGGKNKEQAFELDYSELEFRYRHSVCLEQLKTDKNGTNQKERNTSTD